MELLPQPRSLQTIASELDAHRTYRDALRKVVAEFVALDLRPLVFIKQGDTVEMVPRPLPELPPQVQEAMNHEHLAIHRLEHELHEAYLRTGGRE